MKTEKYSDMADDPDWEGKLFKKKCGRINTFKHLSGPLDVLPTLGAFYSNTDIYSIKIPSKLQNNTTINGTKSIQS